MLEEFKKGLLERNSLEMIAENLKHDAERIAKQRIDEIKTSLAESRYIEYGLRQKQDTIPYQIALGFIRQYEQETGEHMQRSINERLADNAGKEEKAND